MTASTPPAIAVKRNVPVTADFFGLLGVQPFLGRAFVAGEDQPEQPAVAVITHRAWLRRYAADPEVIGRSVRLNTQAHTIVGVLPPGFDAPLVWGPVEFVTPRVIHPDFRTSFGDAWMQAGARLRPEVSMRQAQTELATLAARLEVEHPKEDAGVGLRVVRLHDSNMDSVSRSLLWLMTAISGTMLLIACANLASLQVARAFSRSREFAVRSALGGSRGQLMTPLLLESLTLAAAGGVGGLFVASWSNDLIGRFLLINNEPGFAVPLDGRVLVFAIAASLLSGLAFGLAPAWLASRAPAAEAMKEGARGATASRSHNRLKNVLIVAELALALALVGLAASFGVGAKTFVNRQVGWSADGLFNGFLVLPFNRYAEDAEVRVFHRALLQKLSAIPGVEHAVICTNLPLFSLGPNLPFTVEGQPEEERSRLPIAQRALITSDFFRALQIPLQAGEYFHPAANENAPPVAIINQAFAKKFWPEGNAVGSRVRIDQDEHWTEIVGVVSDVKMLGRFDTPETPFHLYRPLLQVPSRYVTIVLRSALPPELLSGSVREAVAAIDADLPVASAGSVRALYERIFSNVDLIVINLGVSAGMGLLIAAVGLFGVISQLTLQRTRDFGVRMALGAQSADIMRLVLRGGLRLLVVGIVFGVPGFLALNLVLRRAMPELILPGWWLLAANLATLAAAMLLACYLPARRATRISPVDALRAD